MKVANHLSRKTHPRSVGGLAPNPTHFRGWYLPHSGEPLDSQRFDED
jgi:hypothetical protein